MTKPSFGFASLADIHPEEPAAPSPVQREIDRVGERLGFTQREVPQRRRRRAGTDEPTAQFNIRATIADIDSFIGWCERERLSYREAFGLLVAMIDRA